MTQERWGEFYAGLAAPDALRLFGGRDKLSTHFYDDQRRETWGQAVCSLFQKHPEQADPARLPLGTVAWMLGYMCHLATDVAYWRHVISHLPGPPPWEPHHGAWVWVDRLPLATCDRPPRIGAVAWETAPEWIDQRAVRSLVEFLTTRVLPPDDPWEAEIAYHRGGQPGRPSVAELRASEMPRWERNLDLAQQLLSQRNVDAFVAEAVGRSVTEIRAYLERQYA